MVNADWPGFADVDCPRRFELVKFLAEDLSAVEAKTVQEHLVECERCREVLEELDRRRDDFLKKHPADQVVPELLAEARAAANTARNPTIEQYPKGRRWRRPWKLIQSWWSRRRSDRKP